MHRDDTPQSAASAEQATEEDRAGDAAEDEVADLRNVEGEEERAPDVREAEHRPMQASEPSAGAREAAAVTAAAQASQAPSEQVTPQQATGAPQTGGEPEPIVINDGSGSFTIRSVPVGKGPDAEGGDQDPGRPTPHRHSHAGSKAQEGLDLALSWSQFEATFGAEQLREQRQAYLAQKRSHAAGHARKESWRKFRSAIENFVPYVRPGNQTALNAAASPFASYIAAVHRGIHREFVFKFLRDLPLAGGPFGDRSLHTKLEISINGDGSLHHVGVVRSSGFLPFDYGAFNSVNDAAPFPKPPRSILSGDGRAYVHWGFYRNERACGTFNASPFIMPNPPGTPDKRERQPGDGEPVPIDSDYGWYYPPVEPHRHAHR
jgi:hypothetical protein